MPHAIIHWMRKEVSHQGADQKRTGGIFRVLKHLAYTIAVGFQAWLRGITKIQWPTALFLLSLVVYAVVRLIGLSNYPIYFFTDEAAQTVLAQDFIRDGFKNYAGEFLPTYFENGGKYNLGFSVYAQVIPYMLFGKSIFITRATSVFFTWLAGISIGLTLREIFRLKHWWTGVLILSVMPAWFLHSRTAFEVAMAVSLYALFLGFYLAYRFRHRGFLFPALLFGALAFYTYSSMQPIVLATGVFLLFLDGVYHLKNLRNTLFGAGELLALSVPYVRFIFMHPDESRHQLAMLNSYWIDTAPLSIKIMHFFSEYLAGLNPIYWYGTHTHELIRHVMLGYGYLSRILLPFLVIGLGICLYRLKEPLYRILLAVLLAAPVGAAVVQLGITRILVMVIPVTILSAIGLSQCLEWISRLKISPRSTAIVVFILMVGINGWMLVDALNNGPLWYQDYSLDGMQYGANQIFPSVQDFLSEHPDARIVLSPSWANGTDVIARFMLSDPLPIELGSIDGYFDIYREITPNTVFVMIPSELERVQESDKFQGVRILQSLNYPNGVPGFYYVQLEYIDDILERLSEEQEARRQLEEGGITINGVASRIRYSPLDMGVIGMAFDGNDETVIRTREANPMVIELDFNQPILVQSLTFRIGGTTTQIMVYLESDDGTRYSTERFEGEESQPREIVIQTGQPLSIVAIRVEIKSAYDPDPAHVHLWEYTIR